MADKNYTISIDVEAAEAAARSMANTNTKLNDKLNEIHQLMNNMKDIWNTTDAAVATVEKFNQLKGQFDAYYERVKGFTDFVTVRVADAYRTNEKAVEFNAKNIANEKAQANS